MTDWSKLKLPQMHMKASKAIVTSQKIENEEIAK